MLERGTDQFFDVLALNLKLDRTKRRNITASAALLALVALLAFLLIVTDVPRIISGTISSPQLLVFAIGVGGAAIIAFFAARRFPILRRGAVSIRVDEIGIEAQLTNRPAIRMNWTNPHLRFDLHDFSQLNSKALSTETPYFLTLAGVHSALTREAFEAVLKQVQARSLVDQTVPASRWFTPSGAIVHHIHSKAG